MKLGYIIIAAIIVIILLYFLFHHKEEQKPLQSKVTPTQTVKPTQPTLVLGHRTKTSGCRVRGPLPDPDCTPGAAIPGVTKEQVCTHGYSTSMRNVPPDEKDEVYREYGIRHYSPGEYEVDHYIPLGLGGSNHIENLWPEAANPRPGYHEKDRVENYLHKQVCDGKMSLEEAQRQIATNWLAVYEKMPKTTRHKKK